MVGLALCVVPPVPSALDCCSLVIEVDDPDLVRHNHARQCEEVLMGPDKSFVTVGGSTSDTGLHEAANLSSRSVVVGRRPGFLAHGSKPVITHS